MATPQWQDNGSLGLAGQESSHSGRESSHHSGNQGNYHHHYCDKDDYDWRPPRNREHGQNPKMTPYDGKVALQAYEMKLEHMANQYKRGEAEKLNKLVEALQDKALTFYSNLTDNVHENYGPVRRKFNAQFGPKDPSQTVCNQLKVIQQKLEEELEEFAIHCHQLVTDAWGDISMEAVDCAAVDAFLHGTIDSEAAWNAMQQTPQNIDDAFEYLQQAMHN